MEILETFNSIPITKTWYGKLIAFALLVGLLSLFLFILYAKLK